MSTADCHIAVIESPLHQSAAQQVAERLQLPLLSEPDNDVYPFQLQWIDDRLSLRHRHSSGARSTVYVDFVEGKSGYRRRHGGGFREPVCRAVGARQNAQPTVVDLTAGLGADAFVVASCGCSVTLVERSAVVFALLEDGHRRALQNSGTADIAARMKLCHTDSIEWLQHNATDTDASVFYLDPMYPPAGKSAAVRKGMSALRALLDSSASEREQQTDELLTMAMRCADKRVVLKRPANSQPLISADGRLKPQGEVTSGKTRFDIYITRSTGQR